MSDYPHVQAAFINAIREEGSKQEACDWLQKQWNELCVLRKELEEARELLTEAVGSEMQFKFPERWAYRSTNFLERTKP